MKKTLTLIIFSLFLNSELYGQTAVKGIWLVCDSTEICEEESLPLYMLFSDSTMSFLFSMSTGLDPEIVGLTHYKIEDNILEMVDTASSGKVFINHFDLIWKSDDELYLIDRKGEINFYLYRKEE